MKVITLLQAGALLMLAMFGAYAGAQETQAQAPELCVPAPDATDCAL